MNALAEWQRRFAARLFGDAAAGSLEVYRGNVRANLHDALAAAYPVVRRLVGEAFFGEAALRYAAAHPSRSGDLHGYGASLAPFLEGYAPARGLDYLPDVARLEWAVEASFHAADGSALDYAALGAVSPGKLERVRLRLQPSVRLVASPHPIAAIWEANQPGRDGTPERSEGVERVVVHREGFEVRVRPVDEASWRFLQGLASGARLGELAEDEGLAPRLRDELVAWAGRGVIAGPVEAA